MNKRKTTKSMKLFLALAFVIMIWTGGATAQGVSILPIEPVPGRTVSTQVPPSWIQEEGADVYGTVEGLTATEVVVGDSSYLFTQLTTYFAASGSYTNQTSFNIGDQVGLLHNQNNEVITIWKIK